jgi:hypothetical protein
VKIPGLPARSHLHNPVREVLEKVKQRIGHAPLQGTDKRAAAAVLEARPDLKSVNATAVSATIRLTLDELMYAVVSQAKIDTQSMEYEFQLVYSGAQIVVTGDSGYRAIVDRPKNKKKLEKALKREISLALTLLFEDHHLPNPNEFINRVTDNLGRELARAFLDSRVTEETIHSLKVRKR